MAGMLPIVEVMTINFSLLAIDQIVNTAATMRHMSGGRIGVPLVIRMATGGGRQVAAQHSHSLECWYAHVPGLRVLAPATIADARGMLWPALIPMCVAGEEGGGSYHGAMAATAAAVGVHTLTMVATTGLVATLVHDWLGLALLRKAWLNVDALWVSALAATGLLMLAVAN